MLAQPFLHGVDLKPAVLFGNYNIETLHDELPGLNSGDDYSTILVVTTLDANLATSPRLFGEIIKRFRAMMPVVEMLNAPLQKTRVDLLLRT
jgi:hypothetical protein